MDRDFRFAGISVSQPNLGGAHVKSVILQAHAQASERVNQRLTLSWSISKDSATNLSHQTSLPATPVSVSLGIPWHLIQSNITICKGLLPVASDCD
jgi:hypothetical protein